MTGSREDSGRDIIETTLERVVREEAGNFSRESRPDVLAAEEPLEIRVEGKSVAVVMRTPGHDRELVAGFLCTEGIISNREDVFEISPCRNTERAARGNVMDVLLRSPSEDLFDRLTRHVFSSSSCGICGKATIEAAFCEFPPLEEGSSPSIHPETLLKLPGTLRKAQENFDQTGGLHASALFTPDGKLQLLREDVGRHNALDKLIGHHLLEGKLPLDQCAVLMSGRLSFEIMQKALAAGIPIVAGISAPSSLAVDFARSSGQTVIGFLRNRSFNVYTGSARISA